MLGFSAMRGRVLATRRPQPGPIGRRPRWPPSWPGIANLSCVNGTSPHAVDPGRRPITAMRKQLIIRMVTENPPGETDAYKANWSASATASPPPPCGRSCTTPASTPHRAGQAPRGASSSPALRHSPAPTEVTTDRAPAYPRVLDELVPAACHVTEQYGNNSIEADHGRLKSRLRPMRGLKQLRCARVITAGHALSRTSAVDITNLELSEQ